MRGNQRNVAARKATNSVQFTRTALASACALAVGGLGAGGAYAQSLVYTLTSPYTTTYQSVPLTTLYTDYVRNQQESQGAVVGATINTTGTLGTFGGDGGNPVTSSGNFYRATATGQSVSPLLVAGGSLDPTTIDLFLISPTGGTAGALSGQIRADDDTAGASVRTFSTIDSQRVGVGTTAQSNATITTTGSAISSTTQLNASDVRIVGRVPIGYTSPVTTGSIDASPGIDAGATPPTAAVTTQANIAISNNQMAYNAGARANSSASITNSSIVIDLTDAAAQSNTITLTTSDLSATYRGNNATNLITADNSGGGSLSFQGTAALSNAQANIERNTSTAVAATASLAPTTGITANIGNGAATNTVVSGDLVVSQNTAAATSTGNAAGARNATGNGVAASNVITFESGIEVRGHSTPTVNSVEATVSTATSTAANTADVGLMNRQLNTGTYFNSTNEAPIRVIVDTLTAAGSITSNQNTVSSASRGNLAGNLIQAGSTATYSATTGAANVQVNNLDQATGVAASTTSGNISVGVGTALNATAVTGTITANRNTVSSAAEGSAAQTTIQIDATNFTAVGTGAPSAVADTDGTALSSATSGTSATNLQANFGTAAIASGVTTSSVTITAANQEGAAGTRGLSGNTVTANLNAITSGAAGNIGTTSVIVSGSNGVGNANVANTQTSVVPVTANNLDSGVRIAAGGADGITSATVGLTNSTVSSTARGNDATNAVVADFSTLALTGTASNAAAGAAVTATNIATSTGGLAISSAQANSGATTALTQNDLAAGAGGGFATIYARDSVGAGANTTVTTSGLTATGNVVSATNTGNNVSNAIDLPSSMAITTPAGNAMNIASIANGQSQTAAGVSAATVDNGALTVTGIGVTYHPTLTGSTLTVEQNSAQATLRGNQASNTITSAGGTLRNTAGATNADGQNTTAGAPSVEAELSIANRQDATAAATRTSNVQNMTIGVFQSSTTATVGSVGTSTLTVSRNDVTSDARNNDATNNLSLTGYSDLRTTAGVSSSQSADGAAVNGNVTNAAIGVSTVHGTAAAGTNTITGSPISISRNTVSGVAIGSAATNTLTAESTGVLQGNATMAAAGAGVGGGIAPTATADYTLANQQSQTGAAINTDVTASTRLTTTDGTITNAGAISGAAGSVNITRNSLTATARGTEASNTMTLGEGSTVSAATGALASGQTGTGNITASIAGIASGNMVGVDALSVNATPVNVTNNDVAGSGTRNLAINAMTVGSNTSASVAGRGVGTANTDFSVGNTQTNTGGQVNVDANPGVMGVVSNSVVSNTTTVSNNAGSAGAAQNVASNQLNVSAAGSVDVSGTVNNSQSSSGASQVVARLGSTMTPTDTPVSVGVAGLTVDPTITSATISTNNNALSASANRNFAVNGVTVDTAGTISGNAGSSSGLLQSYSTVNSQSDTGTESMLGRATVGTVGVQVGVETGSTFTVSRNTVSAGATNNFGQNAVTLTADGEVAPAAAVSAIVSNTQVGGTGAAPAITASVENTAGNTTVGVVGGATSALSATNTTTVSRNSVIADANRNLADNTLTASGTRVEGTPPAGAAAAFIATNGQTASGNVSANSFVNTMGVQVNAATGGQVTVSNNNVLSSARGNVTGSTPGAGTMVNLTGTTEVASSALATSTQGPAGAAVGTYSSQAGDFIAPTNIGLSVTTTATGVPVTVNRNVMQSDAKVNVSATGVTVDSSDITGAVIGGGLPDTVRAASFKASNTQTENLTGGSVTSLTDANSVGATAAAFAGTNVLTVSNNQLVATGRGNEGATAVTLIGANTISGSARADSTQVSTTNGLVDSATTVATGIGQMSVGGTSNDTTLTTNRNDVQTDSRRNVASTRVDINPAGAAGSVAGAPLAGLLVTGADTEASFVASNDQSLAATVAGSRAITSATRIGLATATLTGTSSVTANRNNVIAQAGDNDGSTAVAINASGTVTGTSMATNLQSSAAAAGTGGRVESTATATVVGSAATTTAANLSTTVTDNNVLAQSVRNLAGTTVTIAEATSITNDPGAAGANLVPGTPASHSAISTQNDTSGGATGGVRSNATPGVYGVTAGALTGTNSVTVTQNVTQSVAASNSANTGVDLSAIGNISGSARTSNTQDASPASASNLVRAAATPSMAGALVTGAASNLSVTVSSNTALADAMRNDAVNTLTLDGGSITGAPFANLVAGTNASFSVFNQQTEGNAAGQGSTAFMSSANGLGASVGGALTGTNSFTVSNNVMQAAAGTNRAQTRGTLTADGAVTGSGLAISSQTSAAGAAVAGAAPEFTVPAGAQAVATTVIIGLQAGATPASTPVSVTGNTQAAQAINNAAQTAMDVDGTSITGDATIAGATVAHFIASNTQTDNTVGGARAYSTYTTVGANVSSMATGSTVSVTDNTLSSVARSNSALGPNNTAGNSVTLDALSSVTGSGRTFNSQTAASTGAVNVTHAGGTVGLATATTATGVAVTASTNTITSEGVRNLALNELKVSAPSVTGTAAGSLVAGNPASFSTRSFQTETGGANSTIANTLTTLGASVVGNLTGPSAVTTESNLVQARARTNSAGTDLWLGEGANAASTINGSALLDNEQRSNFAAGLDSSFTVGTVGVNAGANIDGAVTATVSTNTLSAEASRNVAVNNLRATAATSLSGEADLDAARPGSFSVLNVQQAQTGAATTVAGANLARLGANVTDDVLAGSSVSVTVGTNSVTSRAGGNSAANTVRLDAPTITGNVATEGASAVIDSLQTQLAATGGHTATTNSGAGGIVGLRVGSDILASTPVTVTTNTIAAAAVRNEATNSMEIVGSDVLGADSGVLAGGSASSLASFTTNNRQLDTNAPATAQVGNTTGLNIGVVVAGTVAGAGNSHTVNRNIVSSLASINRSTNTTDLSGVGEFEGSARIRNEQVGGSSAAVLATIDTAVVGSTVGGANSGTNANLTVARNELNANAVQNFSQNTLDGSAATMRALAPNSLTIEGAYAVTNDQTAAAASTGRNNYVTIGTTQAAGVSGTGNAYSITQNNVFATAGANEGVNVVTLQPLSGLDSTATASINSQQSSITAGSTMLAEINAVATVPTAGNRLIGVAITGATTSAPITVSSNIQTANATRNAATNVLNAVGASIDGGTTNANRSYTIINGQAGAADVTSVNYAGLIGASHTGAAGAVGGMTFGVVDNAVLALARMNSANNVMTFDSSSTLRGGANGVAGVTNTQTSGVAAASAISATAGGRGAAAVDSLNIGVVSSGAVGVVGTASSLNVTGNSVSAQGGGNTALNSIDAGATSSLAGAGPLPYTYAVTSGQTNSATVAMTVQFTNIGANKSAALNSTGVTVSGNTASAIGYGNNAVNSLVMSGLAGGVTASATVSNTQRNTASVTALVQGVSIGSVGTGANATGSSIVTNNGVTASAVGNAATNGIVSK